MQLITKIFIITFAFISFLKADDTVIEKIQNQLNSFKQGVLVFTQEDSYGNKDNGLIIFNKPNKARIEYVKSPISIIANASSLVIYNNIDKTKTYIPTSQIPIIGIISKPNLNFKSNDFKVDSFVEKEDAYYITLSSNDKNLGSLTMAFNKQSLNIASWKYNALDKNQNVSVTITNQIERKDINNTIFNVNRIKEININKIINK